MKMVRESLFDMPPTRVIELARTAPPIHLSQAMRSPGSVPIIDCGECLERVDKPVVDVSALHHSNIPGALPTSFVRGGVMRRLVLASSSLPDGLQLALVDGWRSREAQQYMFTATVESDELGAGWVANPDDPSVVPPHTTGGAVDVTLAIANRPLLLGTVPGDYSQLSWLMSFEGAHCDKLVRDLRRLLFAVMCGAGFVPYEQEWWHFSYGDQEWAAASSASHAIYGMVNEVTL